MLCMVMGGCDAMGPWALTLVKMVTLSTQYRYHSDVASLSSQAMQCTLCIWWQSHPIHPTWRCVIIWRNASQTRYNWMEPVLETVTRILCNWCPAPDQNIKTSKQNNLHGLMRNSRDILAKDVQVSPPEPGWERQQAATPKCHWIISYIGLIVRTPIVDLRADTGQIYRNWNVSPRAFLNYFDENFNYFTQLPLKMNKNVCKQ